MIFGSLKSRIIKIPIQSIPAFTSQFHTSSIGFARFPALQTKITRHSHVKNMRKIEQLKKKLGANYKIIGRDKRVSPYSERNSPSKPTQPPAPKNPKKLASRFLISESNLAPVDFVPGALGKMTMEEEDQLKVRKASKVSSNTASSSPSSSSSSISMPSTSAFKNTVENTDHTTVLKLPAKVVPNKLLREGGLEYKTQAKPFFQYSMTPSEAQFLFEKLPAACKSSYTAVKDNTEQQSEMLRRIITMENSNSAVKRKFNTARVVEMLQRHPLDTGSAPVQGTLYSCR